MNLKFPVDWYNARVNLIKIYVHLLSWFSSHFPNSSSNPDNKYDDILTSDGYKWLNNI